MVNMSFMDWDKDHAEYLSAIKIGNETWGIKGGNTEEEYDDNDQMIGAIWVGSAWSWYPGDKLDVERYIFISKDYPW